MRVGRAKIEVEQTNPHGYRCCMLRSLSTAGFLSLVLLAGCGEGTSQLEGTSPATLPTDVEVTGNVLPADGAASILAFAFAELPPDVDPAGREPDGVGSIGPQGDVQLYLPPAARPVVVFLADEARDGVIDPGDATAILLDPEKSLVDLAAGDRVSLTDVQLDFATRRAAAARIEVQRAAGPALAPTPTAGAS